MEAVQEEAGLEAKAGLGWVAQEAEGQGGWGWAAQGAEVQGSAAKTGSRQSAETG